MLTTSNMIGGTGPPPSARPDGASAESRNPLAGLPWALSFGRKMPRAFCRIVCRYAVAVLVVLALVGGFSWAPVLAQPSTSVSELLRRGVEAGADEGLMRSVAERAQQAGTAPEATVEMLAPAVRLAEAGLPAAPVLNKVLEGLAKRVPPPRVQSVANRLARHVQQVGPVVDAWLEREDVRTSLAEVEGKGRADIIMSAANARQQGLALADVQSLLADLPGRARGRQLGPSEVAVAVRATAEMPRGGATSITPSSEMREIVLAAVEAGYTAGEIGQLPVALRQAQASADRPLPALTRDARRAISRGAPASEVIGQLSRGRPPLPPPAAGRGGAGQGPPPGQGKPPDTGPPDTPPGSPPGSPPDTPPQGPPSNPPPPGGQPGGGG